MLLDSLAYTQTATYWGTPVPSGTGGHTYAQPSTMKVRWEERHEQYTDEHGEINVSEAVVFVPVDVEVGGYLFLGESAELDPTVLDRAYEIKQVAKIPDLRNITQERRAFL